MSVSLCVIMKPTDFSKFNRLFVFLWLSIMTKSHFDWSDYLSMEENLKLVKKNLSR